ncbi:uncharacterized protein L201_001114 [Kwoniella dendrophila CBS 6074]|uniref:Uncharacterized protein n=1 Tax=Kwoniella dendrophila CBS 6074 TaxID=1295534 RepID=A0AAX4JMJ1_9TREE
MYNQQKRPSSSGKPFNPAHTHPASISTIPSIQTRQHMSLASSASSSKDKPDVPVEGIQSGGGGGGGAGAGSEESIDQIGINKNSKNEDEDSKKDKSKWNDPKIVHPAWKGFGKGPNEDEVKNDKKRDGKARL